MKNKINDIGLTVLARVLGIGLFFRLYWKQLIAFVINAALVAVGILVLKMATNMIFSIELYSDIRIVLTVMFGIACIIYGAFGMFVAVFGRVKVKTHR